MTTPLHHRTALDIWQLLHDREVSAREVTEHYLGRIDAHGAAVNAFATLTPDAALERADAIDAADDRTPIIQGLPFADKDLTRRAGVRTTFGSRAFAEFVPDASDPIATVLDDAGGISIGKTTTPEFGFTNATSSQLLGDTTIPGHPGLGSGGSSGGAAAAVAAGLLPFAPGNDGGGSVRIPAAACGLVGLKPTRGRIPAHTGLASAGQLTVAGPLARTVADAALLTEAMLARVNGRIRHSFSVRSPEHDDGSLLAAATRGDGRFRIAVLEGSPFDGFTDIAYDPDAIRAQQIAVNELAALGHEIEEHTLPASPEYPAAFLTLWQAGAAGLPVEGDAVRLLEPLTQWLLRQGRQLGARDLGAAIQTLAAFEQRIVVDFDPFDAVLLPTQALPPRPVGWFSDDPETNFAQQVQYTPSTSFVNVTGLPAISLPVHETADGVPMGVQLVGRPGEEATLLAIGRQLERRIPWLQRGLARMPEA